MIEDYLDYISLKRDELGGHAICPFAKSLLNKVKIIESEDFWGDAVQCMNNEKHPVLYLIYGDKDKYDVDWLKRFCSIHEKYSKDKDLWIIWDHPNQINKINGIETNNKEYAILMIQGLSDINKYSDKLHNTNYYRFWSEEYYNDIVKSRKI